jgi:metal-sulfur cluster biosynthetic enzyme
MDGNRHVASTLVGAHGDRRMAEVWAKLDQVMDPELDTSVVEMNFIAALDVDAHDRVHIAFRLPTYWCAANFAFMMADDMRRVVGTLPWVRGVSVTLGEHMYTDKINNGLATGKSFSETFGDEADGNLDDIRRTFLIKAFQGRQEALLSHLIEAGHEPSAFLSWSIADLASLPLDDAGTKLRHRYLERRAIAGPATADQLAFTNEQGAPISAAGFTVYQRGLKRVRINAEFNGALCRGLLDVRFDLSPLPDKSHRVGTATPEDAPCPR